MTKDLAHASLKFYTTSDHFFVVPSDRSEALRIDRVTHDLQLQDHTNDLPAGAEVREIYGLFGIIRLLAGPYIVIITQRRAVGRVRGHDIWKVVDTEVIGFSRTTRHLTEAQERHNREYVSMVQAVLKTDGFYYSTSYDLTHRLQQLENTSPEFSLMSLHERADQRFVWNGHLLRELCVEPDMKKFALPILHGFISINQCTINQKQFTFAVISRRSTFRAGTRFFARGVDSHGHAANFVETEQVIECGHAVASLVQIRGSIPVFWSQWPTLKYKPRPKIIPNASHNDAFRRHCENQEVQYGRQVLINLVNQQGAEKPLADAFQSQVSQMGNPRIQYDAFDFHHECRHMQWQHLSKLMSRVSPQLKEFGYFMVDGSGTLQLRQDGVFRTNCVDCLDRTNVVQSLLARRSLDDQLQRMGVMASGETSERHEKFDKVFKAVWADNADACSVQYSGTGALKTDFTRTGKRTLFGAMRDGWNSAVRYYKNNFADGFRQDAIDLFLGNHIVDSSEGSVTTCPLEPKHSWKYRVLPLVLLFGFSMFIISALLPTTDVRLQLVYVMFWGFAVFATLLFIYRTGPDFVNAPRLVKDKNV